MPVGRRTERWRRWLGPLLVLAAMGTACSDDDGADPATTSTTATTEASSTSSTTTTSTVPERQPSTTTTAFDPSTVEGEVEAAYLKSWDVYADAVYNLELDEEALAEVYAGEGFSNVVAEIEGRIRDGRAALVSVRHQYDIAPAGEGVYSVVDLITNNQVLIDPKTKQPLEEPPNEEQLFNFVVTFVEGRWAVTLVQEIAR